MTEPQTEAGKRLLRTLDYIGAHSQDSSFPGALDDILAIEAEATARIAELEAAINRIQVPLYDAWRSRNLSSGSEDRWDDLMEAAGYCRFCHHDSHTEPCVANVGGPSPEPCYCDARALLTPTQEEPPMSAPPQKRESGPEFPSVGQLDRAAAPAVPSLTVDDGLDELVLAHAIHRTFHWGVATLTCMTRHRAKARKLRAALATPEGTEP